MSAIQDSRFLLGADLYSSQLEPWLICHYPQEHSFLLLQQAVERTVNITQNISEWDYSGIEMTDRSSVSASRLCRGAAHVSFIKHFLFVTFTWQDATSKKAQRQFLEYWRRFDVKAKTAPAHSYYQRNTTIQLFIFQEVKITVILQINFDVEACWKHL